MRWCRQTDSEIKLTEYKQKPEEKHICVVVVLYINFIMACINHRSEKLCLVQLLSNEYLRKKGYSPSTFFGLPSSYTR